MDQYYEGCVAQGIIAGGVSTTIAYPFQQFHSLYSQQEVDVNSNVDGVLADQYRGRSMSRDGIPDNVTWLLVAQPYLLPGSLGGLTPPPFR